MGEAVAAVRQAVEADGPGTLVVDDLTEGDLEGIAWSGSATHIRYVREALERVPLGEVEYLALRAPGGEPVAKAGIDYSKRERAGEIWQLATHGELQGLGLGTRLIRAAEDRIRRRGVRFATLGVEDENPHARRLYERLGYRAYARERTSWEQEGPDGNVSLYETEVTLLHKELASSESKP